MCKWRVAAWLLLCCLHAACRASETPTIARAAPSVSADTLLLKPTAPLPVLTATRALTPTATLPPPRAATVSFSPTHVSDATRAPSATPTLAFTATPPAPTALFGDAARGAAWFETMGCKGCHMPPPKAKRRAPDLSYIRTDAARFLRLPDYHGAAADVPSYIRESIVDPNAFVVPAFRYLTLDGSSNMPQDFASRLSAQALDDLIVFVLTLE